MSRLPLKDNHLGPHDKAKRVNQLQFDSLPVNAHQIRTATRHDLLFSTYFTLYNVELANRANRN